jgi:hypothetical protein
MIDTLIAAAIWIGPTQQPDAIQSINRTAARAARDIPTAWEPFQACVIKRESGGRVNAQNPKSSAQGLYQFLDNKWRHGGGWNVKKRLIRFGYDKATATFVLRKLHATPIKKWRPVYQDILFAEVIENSRIGWKHWYLAGSRCNGLVPA